MPLDVAKMSGRWTFGRHSDNYPQIREKLGITDEIFDTLGKAGIAVKTSLSGKVMTFGVDFMGKERETTHTLGVEGVEDARATGGKIKVTYTIEGDSLVALYPDHDGKGLYVRNSRHFVDNNTIHHDIKAGDLEGWVEFKRC